MYFNSKSVAGITGLSYRQIDYWDRSHLIKPSASEASGRGTSRLYSFNDLVQLKVAKTLIDKGITVQKIRKALGYLKKNMPEIEKPLAELKFLTDGETIFVLARDNKAILDALKSGLIFPRKSGHTVRLERPPSPRTLRVSGTQATNASLPGCKRPRYTRISCL